MTYQEHGVGAVRIFKLWTQYLGVCPKRSRKQSQLKNFLATKILKIHRLKYPYVLEKSFGNMKLLI